MKAVPERVTYRISLHWDRKLLEEAESLSIEIGLKRLAMEIGEPFHDWLKFIFSRMFNES